MHRSVSFDLFVHIYLNRGQHDDNYDTKSYVENEAGYKETIGYQEWVI